MFGGTFDPFHNGHLAIVEAALSSGISPLVVVPTAQPPHRHAPMAGAAHRLAMCRAALAGLDGVEISDLEVSRGGISYTVDTLELLTAARPVGRWWLVVGGDAPPGLAGWRDAERIFALADVVVAPRPGTPPPTPPMAPLAMAPIHVGAKRIRKTLAEGGTAEGLVPAAVLAYIREHSLYAEEPA